MKLIVNTDGGARGNPGPAGLGVVIRNEDRVIVKEFGEFLGNQTNNFAEYSALIRALEESKNLSATHVDVRMDSELIVRQMNGQYKIKEPTLQVLAQKVLNLKKDFASVTFTHVRRELNKDADRMVNEGIDKALLLQ